MQKQKIKIFGSLVLAMGLLLAACSSSPKVAGTSGENGQGANPLAPQQTTSPSTQPAQTGTVTESAQSTSPGTGPATGTAALPSTGSIDSDRITNLLKFEVWSQNNQKIGAVEDLILNLETRRADYVVVKAGEKSIPVPWQALKITSSTSQNGTQNGFVLTVDQAVIEGAPEIDWNALPAVGENAAGWDAKIRSYWQGKLSSPGANAPNPPQANNPGAAGMALAGVIRASKLLGSSYQVGGNLATLSVNDILLDVQSGAVHYVVISLSTGAGVGRLIPIPLNVLGWDSANKTFTLNVDPQTLLKAPSFTIGDFPNTLKPGWDNDLRSYWKKYLSPGTQ